MQAMSSATQDMLGGVWSEGGIRDVYADFNELTLNITTIALFGVDMSSRQALGISGRYHTGVLCIAACSCVHHACNNLHPANFSQSLVSQTV